jgi:polysaccharide deacetylase 2 family uncharacterized protein YibQ
MAKVREGMVGRALAGWRGTVLPAALGVAVGLVLLALLGDPSGRAPDAPRPKAPAIEPRPATPPSIQLPPRPRRDPVMTGPAVPAPPPKPLAGATPGPPPATAEPAWRRNAVAAAVPAGRALVAVIIDDMGLDRRQAQAAVALPGPLTLSYLPYAGDLPAQTRAARSAGHELMVHVPMEPEQASATVPTIALSVDLEPVEAARRLEWALGRFDGFVGINNHMGSRFTADAGHLRPVLQELKRRGLLFVDSRTSPRSAAPELARALRLPFASRDVFLDHDDDAAAIRARLRELEEIARQRGHAIAIGHPRERTLAALREWLPTLAARGFVLVPISAVVHRLGPA